MRGTMDRINVAIRFRPLNEREKASNPYEAWSINSSSVVPVDRRGTVIQPALTYSFDKMYGPEDSNDKVYDEVVSGIIDSTLDGVNGTIFAYGQTSSGKTFTMQGCPQSPGIIPQAVSQIFQKIKNTPGREFLLRISYLEIYNEIIKDLLNKENVNLKIHETPNVGHV